MVQTDNQNSLVYKIIMWAASLLLIGAFSFIMNKIEIQGREIASCKIEIAVTKEQYKAIDQRLNDILLQLKDNNRKLDRHMENEKK